ncbi:MAG TPA: hypothetical protein VFF27_10405 [Bacteroidia bacterium]|jgi:hypothetical protein|nr:hypothetical protein [Bacteroidia bacterium]
MTRFIPVLLTFIFLPSFLLAQESGSCTFGKPKMEELTNTVCKIDPGAAAMILYEKGEVELGVDPTYNLILIHHYHFRYKIFDKRGLPKATFTITFEQGGTNENEIIKNIEGCTYNLVKERISKTILIPERIKEIKLGEIEYQKVIDMPDVKEGSVFDIRYTVEKYITTKQYNPKEWVFQHDLPVMWSEYRTSIPVRFNYRIGKTGAIPIQHIQGEEQWKYGVFIDTRRTAVNIFTVKDMPSFQDEPYLNSRNDYIPKVNYELANIEFPNTNRYIIYILPKITYTENWDQAYLLMKGSGEFGEKFRKDGLLGDAVQAIQPVKDTMERIKRAFEYVSKRIHWNGEMSLHETDDPKEVFIKREASATEINLILVSLLQQLDLQAYPVILSTRGNGKIETDYPLLDQFNYTIATVNLRGKYILMDATDPLTKPGMLPLRCLNEQAILLANKGSRPIPITPIEKDAQMEMMRVAINTNGDVEGMTKISKSGYNAHDARELLLKEGDRNFISAIEREEDSWLVKDVVLENRSEINEPFTISYNFNFSLFEKDKTIQFSPMFSERETLNPFNEDYRIYPIDLAYGKDKMFIAEIQLPADFDIVELPKSATINLPDNMGKFTYFITTTDHVIKISSRITLNEYYFTADEYETLKNFYQAIIAKHAERILLKRKG